MGKILKVFLLLEEFGFARVCSVSWINISGGGIMVCGCSSGMGLRSNPIQ